MIPRRKQGELCAECGRIGYGIVNSHNRGVQAEQWLVGTIVIAEQRRIRGHEISADIMSVRPWRRLFH